MARTPATAALDRAGVAFEAREYDFVVADAATGTTYGQAVAAQIGVSEDRVFKTLVATVDDAPVVAIIPVTGRVALKRLARAAGGKKAAMADPALAERLTGYVTGGISPFGRRRELPVYLDESALAFGSIFVSGGRRGLQLGVATSDLVGLLAPVVAPLTD
jgi:Cys-tRNA(Pro)/Cys-tRNA(Cys) deacylase